MGVLPIPHRIMGEIDRTDAIYTWIQTLHTILFLWDIHWIGDPSFSPISWSGIEPPISFFSTLIKKNRKTYLFPFFILILFTLSETINSKQNNQRKKTLQQPTAPDSSCHKFPFPSSYSYLPSSHSISVHSPSSVSSRLEYQRAENPISSEMAQTKKTDWYSITMAPKATEAVASESLQLQQSIRTWNIARETKRRDRRKKTNENILTRNQIWQPIITRRCLHRFHLLLRLFSFTLCCRQLTSHPGNTHKWIIIQQQQWGAANQKSDKADNHTKLFLLLFVFSFHFTLALFLFLAHLFHFGLEFLFQLLFDFLFLACWWLWFLLLFLLLLLFLTLFSCQFLVGREI